MPNAMPQDDLQLDLEKLPSSLKRLHVTGATILPVQREVGFTLLEKLTIQWTGDSGEAVVSLLDQLPKCR